MTGNTEPTEKVRAVFLAALMVLSVFAMSAAFAGSAAAAVNTTGSDGGISLDSPTVSEGDNATGTVNVSSNKTDVQVWIDVNDDGDYDSSEPNVTVDNSTFEDETDPITVPFDGLNTTGLNGTYNVSVNQTEPMNTSVQATANASLTVEHIVVKDLSLSAPRVAPNDSDITVEATIKNVGESTQEVNVTLGAANNSFVNDDSASPEAQIAYDNQTELASDESFTVEFTPNSYDNYTANNINQSEDVYHGVYVLNNDTANTFQDGAEAPFFIGGSDVRGAVEAEITDDNGDPIPDANVSLYINSVDSTNLVDKGVAGGGDENNFIRFTDLAIGNDQGSGVQYIIRADKATFQADNRGALLHENNVEETVSPTLISNLDAQAIEIVRADDLTDKSNATLLADGNSDNTAEFAVITQNQINESISSSLDVNLAFNDAVNSSGDFINNDAIDRSTTVTISGSNTASIDESVGDVNAGEVSYTTFEVTADNATAERLQSLGDDPIGTYLFDAEATNESTTLTDTASVDYVLEGNDVLTGDVRTPEDLDMEDVTLWAAYEGQSNQSLEFIQDTFVNAEGDAFLVETSAEGGYMIDGIALNETVNTDIRLYAVASEEAYNNLNLTDQNVGQFVAFEATVNTSEWQDVSDGTFKQAEQNVNIFEEDVDFEYRMDIEVEDAQGNLVKSADVAQDNSREVSVTVEKRPIDRQGEWSSDTVEDGKEVTVSLTDETQGSLAETTLTVEDGQATTTFTAASAADGTTNVSAETENDLGEINATSGSDEAEINVYGPAAITGDVVNEDSQNLPGATVTLYADEDTDLSDPLTSVEAGDEGSYTISEIDGQRLQSDESYIVQAAFPPDEEDPETETRDFDDLSAGTNDGDIAIIGVTPEVSEFEITNVDPADNVSVAPGDTVSVDVTVENIGDELGTKDVEFVLDGDVVATESVELSGNENKTVTLEATAPDAAGDYAWMVQTDGDMSDSWTLTVEASNGNDLSRFDTDGDDLIGFQEVLDAIDAYNNDGQIGGEDVGFQDVLDAIDAYNNDTEV